jgi:hypothetical protein
VAMRLRDAGAATRVLEWGNKDALSPCPDECNVDITAFDVKDIPDARGVRTTGHNRHARGGAGLSHEGRARTRVPAPLRGSSAVVVSARGTDTRGSRVLVA